MQIRSTCLLAFDDQYCMYNVWYKSEDYNVHTLVCVETVKKKWANVRHSQLNYKKYCKELKILWFEMGNCCLNIPHLNDIDYKSHEHEAESKNANKTWPAGTLLWHNANIANATWRWGTLIYRTLFINLCHTKLTAEQYPSQNLLMIKQTRMISKTEKKSLLLHILSWGDSFCN